MQPLPHTHLQHILLLLVITAGTALSLRIIQMSVPPVIRSGDDGNLMCLYDLEQEHLYSTRWYKGRREFYRYTPKENPAKKTFPVPGINVEISKSNASHITLSSVELSSSGRYSCEVTLDAPSFMTGFISSDLEVVEFPQQRPSISGAKLKYRVGDVLTANCSSKQSKPAANLTWTINDAQASSSHVRLYKPVKDETTNLETSILGVHFLVARQYFLQGKLKIKCTAQIYNVYNQSTEQILEEDRPQVVVLSSDSSPLGPPNVNMVHSPYDQSSLHDEIENDAFMTHIQADMSSSRSPITISPFARLWWISLITITSALFHLMSESLYPGCIAVAD
ncbi:uncharacterized protein LOC129789722 [Lutzomyia longipalpis]|uniref:uncharacterized protein LOC129789722 n=1 Tax=Lutzomyia longipalpis TaxID=7200 RepID=UPI002483E6E0|nr:uncharacterized protein LOC129789722 [Lutzomyia longipalpis]